MHRRPAERWLELRAGRHRVRARLGLLAGVARMPEPLAAPGAAPWLAGVAITSDVPVLIADLAAYLDGRAAVAPHAGARLVIARRRGLRFGLKADDALGPFPAAVGADEAGAQVLSLEDLLLRDDFVLGLAPVAGAGG